MSLRDCKIRVYSDTQRGHALICSAAALLSPAATTAPLRRRRCQALIRKPRSVKSGRGFFCLAPGFSDLLSHGVRHALPVGALYAPEESSLLTPKWVRFRRSRKKGPRRHLREVTAHSNPNRYLHRYTTAQFPCIATHNLVTCVFVVWWAVFLHTNFAEVAWWCIVTSRSAQSGGHSLNFQRSKE